ncbi:MAG: DEAD/DEAH box helicase [Oscillospiraceae bacterium]|nr:DEAD/DEAH box helicase [Oscillospiraceae bacterium]
MNFNQLPLTRPLQRAVAEAGYTTPTPIQQKAIPPVLEGHDLLGCAQTGTGKTAAFALPILQLLAARRPSHKKVRALILTPTRELALQIGESFSVYSKYLTVTSTVVFGGVGQAPQVAALQKGVDVLIACPGRLNDLIGQGYVSLDALEIFVLDEADRMLDMGFIHDVKKVIARLPARRQNLMFSATMPQEIEELAAGFLKAPVFVKVDPVSSTVDKIDQKLYFVSKADKRRLLPHLLQDETIASALVFSRTKHGADRIARELTRAGIPAAAIHGNKSQSARVAALEGFKAGKTRVLVATDIAARGIDISELSHVFNFDLPEVPETYVHRIGRTARAGQSGCAISFCCPEEREYLAGIEKLNRKKIPVVEDHPWADGSDQPAPPKAPLLKKKENSQEQPAPRPEELPLRRKKAQEARPEQKGKEESPVEEKMNAPKEGKKEGLSASAKRRRRRHRSNAAREAAAALAAGAPAKEEAPAREEQPTKAQSQKQRPVKPARQEKPARPAREARENREPARETREERPAAPAPRQEKPARQPQPPKKQERPAPAPAKPARPVKPAEEDPGLLLISRRPPAQKFASFEEYMKCHGGFSAPAEGEEE